MSFHPASNGLIPLREKTVPASPADVIFAGVERADMRYEQFEIKVDEQIQLTVSKQLSDD